MKSQYQVLFTFAALLLAVSLACVRLIPPTATLVPTNPLPPTNAAQPTADPLQPPTPSVDQPSSALEFFTENFDGGFSDWSVFKVSGSKDTNESGITLETDGGYLVFDVNTKYLYTYLIYEPHEYTDVVIEASVENRGTNNNNISLICRYSDEGWYEFNIANNGLYNILYGSIEPDGDIGYSLLADGGSTKIKSGKDVNVYKIICKGRRLTLFINGTETRVIDDNQYVLRDGKVGISTSSFDDLPVKVEYDWVTISEP